MENEIYGVLCGLNETLQNLEELLKKILEKLESK